MHHLARLLGSAFPWALAVVLAAALLLVARDSLLLVLLGIAAAAGVAVVVIFGPHRTGVGAIVVGTLGAPMSALVLPMATFVTLADLFYVIGFILLIPTIIGNKHRIPPGFAGTALACLGIGLVATLASPDWLTSLNFQARFIAGVLVLPTAFLLWRPSRAVIHALCTAYVLGVMVSLYGGIALGDRPGGRFIGFTEHPNVYGLTGLFAVGLVTFMLRQVKQVWVPVWLFFGASSLAVIWFSGSRAALVVAGALALAFPVIERSAKTAAWLLGSVATLLLVADRVKIGGGSALDRLLGGEVSSNSDAAREELFNHYLDGFWERPFLGHGFEESVLGHNVYLQMAYSMGALGALAFFALLCVGAAQLLSAPKPFNRVAYPIVSYAMIAPLTSVVWDRYIWVPATLSFLLAADVARQRAGQPTDLLPMPEPEPERPAGPGKRRANVAVDHLGTRTSITAAPSLRPRR